MHMEVDSAFTHYPESGVVNTPAFYPPLNQGRVTSPQPQMGEYLHSQKVELSSLPIVQYTLNLEFPRYQINTQSHHQSVAAAIGPHRSTVVRFHTLVRLDCLNHSMRSPSFSGPYSTSNPHAAHMLPFTPGKARGPALQTRKRERSYGPAGVAASSFCLAAHPPLSSTTRATGGEPLLPHALGKLTIGY